MWNHTVNYFVLKTIKINFSNLIHLISDNSYNMNITNNLISNVNLTENDNLNSQCLCCSQASYHILALDINIMNRCCLRKIYSLRSLLINKQY